MDLRGSKIAAFPRGVVQVIVVDHIQSCSGEDIGAFLLPVVFLSNIDDFPARNCIE